MNPYVRAAVDAEIGILRGVSSGRACATFRAAAAIGGFVGADEMDRSEAELALVAAATQTGLPEREALGHVRRGLRRGEMTPRSLPETNLGECSRFSPRPPTSATPNNLPFEEPPARPPKAEVDELWGASVPVGADPEVTGWFCNRFCYHPSDGQREVVPTTSSDPEGFCYRYHPSWVAEHIELWDLARAIPASLDLPRWAWSRGGPWTKTGHRALFRLWDDAGRLVSLRARCVDPTSTPKSLAPCGFSAKGLVLADPLGVQLLSGVIPAWWEPQEVVISEGEPDWLTWAARQNDAHEEGPAYFGVEAGAWSQQIADRIPDGARVAIRTHHDEPGKRYARQIAATLRGRCHLFRSQAGKDASR